MSLILAIIAVIPAIALMVYVYMKDRSEKEPIKLLVGLFFAGVLSIIPAIIFEVILGNIWALFGNGPFISAFTEAFLTAGLVEEICKFVFLYLITHKNPNFNSVFDGLIYSIFVSLGFAAAENIKYVLSSYVSGGLQDALQLAGSRSIMSIPGHMFFAVFMGYFYSMFHISELASKMENQYASAGMLAKREPAINGSKYMALTLIVPICVHGFYDFCLMYAGNTTNKTLAFTLVITFLVFLLSLYIVCFIRIRNMSKIDGPDTMAAAKLLYTKYPEFLEYAKQQASATARAQQIQYQNQQFAYQTQQQQAQQTNQYAQGQVTYNSQQNQGQVQYPNGQYQNQQNPNNNYYNQ